MNYEESINFLYSKEESKIKLGLSNIKHLLKKMGNPQDNLKIIHVAGTNGKGSVCAIISSILKELGYTVGTYTSPHLTDIKERIMIDGNKISKADFSNILGKIRKNYTNQSFFEIITALAFEYFDKQGVDFAVMEVGMGGRLDATNAADSMISVITNVSFDHTKYLGDSIEKIAFEKGGIIKNDSNVVTGTEGKSLKVIEKICNKRNCKLYKVKKINKNSNLKGEFQKENIAIALQVIDLIGSNEKAKKEGLKNVKWPGRMQFIEDNFLVDGAHNTSGIQAFVNEIKKLNYEKLYFIFGVMKDKNIERMSDLINNIADEVIVTRPKIKRSSDTKKISKYFDNCVIKDNVKGALKYARKAGKKDIKAAGGSLYLIGDIFKALGKDPFD